MLDLTNEVQSVFSELVSQASWLTNATKKLTENKIQSVIHNIGYPDFILDDAQLQKEIEGVRKLRVQSFGGFSFLRTELN